MSDVEKLIGYAFSDKTLLATALTHTSFAHEHNCESYERLEYVGDALADFVVGEYLFENFNVNAGLLSKYRAKLVSTETFADIIKKHHLDEFIRTGKSIKSLTDSIRADVFESIVASIYFDGGIDSARDFVKKFLLIDKEFVIGLIGTHIDYKTTLQETLQAMTPQKSFRFEVVDESGKDNNKMFDVALYIDGVKVSTATGKSHKQCEQDCAKKYLESKN